MNPKELVLKYPKAVAFACRVHNLGACLRIRNKGKGNRIKAPCALLKKTRIRICGSDNEILIGDFSQLNGVNIEIHGSGNRICLGAWGTYTGTEIYVEQDHNEILVGDHAHLYGKVEMAAMEGTAIRIGEDCLCSANIQIRTGDSHAVLDLTGCRINPSRDITLGKHVWLGRNVMILKGSTLGDHCLVGAGALLAGSFPEPNCSVAGVPARILKRNVDWSVHHIPVGEKAPDFQPPEIWQQEP